MYTHTHSHMYTHTYTHTCTHTGACTHTRTCTRMHTHTCTRACMHAHTHNVQSVTLLSQWHSVWLAILWGNFSTKYPPGVRSLSLSLSLMNTTVNIIIMWTHLSDYTVTTSITCTFYTNMQKKKPSHSPVRVITMYMCTRNEKSRNGNRILWLHTERTLCLLGKHAISVQDTPPPKQVL